MNLQGQVVYSESLTYTPIVKSINSSGWPSGTYVIQITAADEVLYNEKVEILH